MLNPRKKSQMKTLKSMLSLGLWKTVSSPSFESMTSGNLKEYVIILLENVNREMFFWWKYFTRLRSVVLNLLFKIGVEFTTFLE